MDTTLVAPSPSSRPGLDAEAVETLRSQLGGSLLLPEDPGYDDARRVWNGMIDKRPALIVRPSGAADVQQAITFAREHGLAVSIKGGGHNVAGHAVGEGGLMIDMGAMRAVWVDPVARTARVQGGATWADLDRETAAFGLATTGGVISSTGVAGLTLGGGIGWLVGKHGMAIDNLLSVDLVTADGEFVTASVESHPDLFWALRGGGGNFGVATSFEFALHPQGDVLAVALAYPVERAPEILAFYRDFTESAPDELTIYAEISTDPESGERVVAIGGCWPGDLDEGERVVAPLRALENPLIEMIEPMPYAAWQAAFDTQFPEGYRYYWKGSLMRGLADEVLAAVVEHASDPPVPFAGIAIEWYRGPMNRVDPAATAFAHRDARYQLVIVGATDDPTEDDTAIAWTRGLHQATEQHALNGAFLNFNSLDGPERRDRVRAGYGANWDRLVEVKRRYDPTNLFRENNNVAP